MESLFAEDEDCQDEPDATTRERTVRVQSRNQRAVRDLKELYRHRCQITGTEYLFRKPNGEYYTEAHHLVHLGSGGANDPRNIVILSPLVHRMLHYAEVSEIDLSTIELDTDGSAKLDIVINGQPYKIAWHPAHARRVQQHDET